MLYLFDDTGETIKSKGMGEEAFHRTVEEPLAK